MAHNTKKNFIIAAIFGYIIMYTHASLAATIIAIFVYKEN